MLSDRIPYYILDLLQLTPSVYVEGLGRFQAIFHSAQLDSTKSRIAPPHIEGAFRPDEKEASKTLEAFIHYTSGDHIESPKEAIAAFVRSVFKNTQDGTPYEIDKFGIFLKSDKSNLRFTPDWDAFNISFNGLESIELKPVPAETPVFVPLTPPEPYVPKSSSPDSQAEEEGVNDEEITVASIAAVDQTKEAFEKNLDRADPSNSKLWWILLMTAIVLIAMLCVYLAWDIMHNRSRLNELKQARADTAATTPIKDNTVDQYDSIPDGAQDLDNSTSNSTNEPSKAVPDEAGPPCYIVVGAFSDPANVTRMVERLKSMNYKVKEIQGRTLTKVAIQTSCDQERLNRVLNDVRSTVNPESWIY